MDQSSKIAIIGYGIEGQAMAEYLRQNNYQDITICDKNESLEINSQYYKAFLGTDYLNNLDQFDVIFRSPGLTCLHPKIIPVKDKVTSQINYFLEQAPSFNIGVTGTKGKGTTSTLIHKILLAGQNVSILGGNIGDPAINYLDKLQESDFSVLELSSFQLQDLKKSLNVGVVLNITSEHLDYHADRNEYVYAKLPIIKHQAETDYVVVNSDYPTSKMFLEYTPAKPYTVSTKHEVEQGAYVVDQKIFIKINGTEEFLLATDEVGLLGPHNLENILPAITVGRILGVDINIIRQVVKEFTGLPHRLELVDQIEEVSFYNDSFSTVPETAIAALNSFPQGKVIILLGGSEKHSDYTELGKFIAESLALPICYGKTGPRIKESILQARASYPVYETNDMDEAFQRAQELSKPGDIVMLSPASASFDLFLNYKERGKKFRELVASIQKDHPIKTDEVIVNDQKI